MDERRSAGIEVVERSTDELKGMLQVYGVTPIAPLIRYKLANLYLNENKFDEAKKEYEYILEKFPKHPLTQQVTQLLNQLKVNEEWAKGELSKQLAELNQKRNMPRLTVKTTKGDFEIELYEDDAPNTVANFTKLAGEGFYNGGKFHRVIPGFMIQGGDPKGDGTGGPGYKFNDEPFQGEYSRGTIAMANAGENTNGSQFFIMVNDVPLPYSYTIFGKVVEGQEVAYEISKLPTDGNDKPLTPVVIDSVTLE